MYEEPLESCEPILLNAFGFHPLAVDDALRQTHISKVDDWGDYIYLVFHTIQYNSPSEAPIQTQELDIFLGKPFLVTYHLEPVAPIESVWGVCQRDNRPLSRGSAYLLYQLLDDLIAHYMAVVEGVNQDIDLIENQVFSDPKPATLEGIFTLRRMLLQLRHLLVPQREVLYKLSRVDFQVIETEFTVFFRDVYDHAARLDNILESLRDLAGSALEIYLSVINNRMNEVMKTLTVITTLFMPLAFITGFFGMNFFQATLLLEAWTGRLAFAITMAIIVLVPVGMYLWMRRRAWM
jgi:magnesium transporter